LRLKRKGMMKSLKKDNLLKRSKLREQQNMLKSHYRRVLDIAKIVKKVLLSLQMIKMLHFKVLSHIREQERLKSKQLK